MMAPLTVIITTLMTMPLSSQSDDAPLWNTFDQAAWKLLQKHRYAEAEKTFRDAIARKPDNGHRLGRSKTGLAWALFHQGRYREACLQASAAEQLTIEPVTPEQRIRRADCLHILAKTMCNECKWTLGQKYLEAAKELLQEVGGQEEQIAVLTATSGEFFLWQFLPVEALGKFALALPDTRNSERRATLVLNQTAANLMRGELTAAGTSLALGDGVRPSAFEQMTQMKESELSLGRRSWLALQRAELAYMQGRFNDAKVLLASADPCPVTVDGALRCLNERHVLAAAVAVQMGNFSEAQHHMTSMTPHMEWERPLVEAEQLEIQGEIAAATGEFSKAAECFRQSILKKQSVLPTIDPRLMSAWFGVAAAHNYLTGLRQPMLDAHEHIQRILVRMKATRHPALFAAMRLRAQHQLYHRDALEALQLCADANEKLQGRLPMSHPERANLLETKALAELTQARQHPESLSKAAESIQQASTAGFCWLKSSVTWLRINSQRRTAPSPLQTQNTLCVVTPYLVSQSVVCLRRLSRSCCRRRISFANVWGRWQQRTSSHCWA